MIFTGNKFYRILTFALALAILSGLVWIQASVSPVVAQGPGAGEGRLSLLVITGGQGLDTGAVDTPPVFKVGHIFTVSIVALGVSDPGIFGGQFEISYDTNHLAALDGTLVPGPAMELVALANINAGEGLVEYGASRKGDVENLSGNVVLASLSFEAVGATEPPEGQTTVIDLKNVKLGARGGIEVPVAGVVDLEIIIVEDGETGDLTGNVSVEGHAPDNQAGHIVADDGSLSTTTDAFGNFSFVNIAFGTYNFTASSPGFLAATCTGAVHNADPTSLPGVTLLAGDIDDNGDIDITDATTIGAALGSGDPDAIADLNDDGVVDILDLIWMAANFGQTSTGNPWLCQ